MSNSSASCSSTKYPCGVAYSPLIPKGNADMILAFEPAEAVRNLCYLRKDGIAIVNSVPVKPVTESLKSTGYDGTKMIDYLKSKCQCIVVDSEEICKNLGSSKFFNVAILGVAAGTKKLGIDANIICNQLETKINPKFSEINKKAFAEGLKIGEKYAD